MTREYRVFFGEISEFIQVVVSPRLTLQIEPLSSPLPSPLLSGAAAVRLANRRRRYVKTVGGGEGREGDVYSEIRLKITSPRL